MERTAVKSSNIAAIGFELGDASGARLGTLDVEFVNGSVYSYSSVPESVYLGIVGAPSVGAAFNIAIKKAATPYVGVKMQDARARDVAPVAQQLDAALANRCTAEEHSESRATGRQKCYRRCTRDVHGDEVAHAWSSWCIS